MKSYVASPYLGSKEPIRVHKSYMPITPQVPSRNATKYTLADV